MAGCISPLLADLFNHANLALVHAMTCVTDLLLAVPLGNVKSDPAPPWTVLAWYAGVIAMAAWLRSGESKGEGPDADAAEVPF